MRAALLRELQTTLDGQQQADLQAALERRPMMPLGNGAGAHTVRLQMQR